MYKTCYEPSPEIKLTLNLDRRLNNEIKQSYGNTTKLKKHITNVMMSNYGTILAFRFSPDLEHSGSQILTECTTIYEF